MQKLNDLTSEINQRSKLVEVRQNGKCERCGNNLEINVIERADGTRIEKEFGCTCNIIDQHKERQEAMILKRYKDYSITPNSYDVKTINEYEPKDNTQLEARRLAIEYLENLEAVLKDGNNFTLLGASGTGKTHISMAIYNYAIKKGYNVLFLTVTDYFNVIKDGYAEMGYDDRKRKYSEMTQRLAKEADLLILDDLGTSKLTEWANEQLFDLINSRVGKSTLVTSNYSQEVIASNPILNRWFSRLRNNGVIHTIKGVDYRAVKQLNTFKK